MIQQDLPREGCEVPRRCWCIRNTISPCECIRLRSCVQEVWEWIDSLRCSLHILLQSYWWSSRDYKTAKRVLRCFAPTPGLPPTSPAPKPESIPREPTIGSLDFTENFSSRLRTL